MYVVVSIDRATQYCTAYGTYSDYAEADAKRIKMIESRPWNTRMVYVIPLEAAQ